jgi:hypothetical protein
MKTYPMLEIISGSHALDQISEDWIELTEKMEKKRFFHMIEYYRAYMEALEKEPESIYFFILRDGENIAAILPFRKVIRRIGPIKIKVLESVQHTNPQLVDFQYDFIMQVKEDSGSIFQAFLDNLEKSPEMEWDIISVRNVFDDSYAASALSSSISIKKQCRFSQKCYYLATDSYDEIIQNTSGNFRRNLRRVRKRLSDLGPSSFTSIKEFPGMEEAYTNFLNLEGSGWKRQQGTAIIQLNDATKFYRSIINYFSNLDCCEIHELKSKDQTIASFFSIKDDNACYLPKIGYDEQFDEVSPGKQLFDYFIKRCCDMHQTKELIFLSNASHLEHWKPPHYTKLNYYLFNSNLQGNIGYIFKMVLDTIEPYDHYLIPYYKFIRIGALRKLTFLLR